MQPAPVSRLLTDWVTRMDEQARPSATPKRPHFNVFSAYLCRYTLPFAIVSVHQNFCAVERACERLADRPGDAAQIGAKHAKSIKIWGTVSPYSEQLAMNGRLSLLVRVCLLHRCSLLCCSTLIRFCWCSVQAELPFVMIYTVCEPLTLT